VYPASPAWAEVILSDSALELAERYVKWIRRI